MGGGAIFFQGATLSLFAVSFSNNTAGSNGDEKFNYWKVDIFDDCPDGYEGDMNPGEAVVVDLLRRGTSPANQPPHPLHFPPPPSLLLLIVYLSYPDQVSDGVNGIGTFFSCSDDVTSPNCTHFYPTTNTDYTLSSPRSVARPRRTAAARV